MTGDQSPDLTIRSALDRRTLIAGAASIMVCGCTTCADLQILRPITPAERPLIDGHAHFFNAADLPIAGFLENVLLPELLIGFEALWPALISLSRVLKRLAVTADLERADLARSVAHPALRRVTVERYANVIGDEIEARLAARADQSLVAAGEDTSVEDSFAILAILVAETSARERGVVGPLEEALAEGVEPLERVRTVDRAMIARAAVLGSAALSKPIAGLSADPAKILESANPAALASLWDGVKWLHAMVQPRCAHVHDYLTSISSRSTCTLRVVNLLVDFDSWLGDTSSAGSEIGSQLRFWTDYRKRAEPRLSIETFAPYDPLRHAEDRMSRGDDHGYFARVKRWAERVPGDDVRIAGFKLYPPMGFKAIDNAGEPPVRRAGRHIRRRWIAEEWALKQFGHEIETSLESFFDFCGTKGLPIMAHGRASNAASPGAALMASPAHWLERIKRCTKPLRICLGHFSPGQFGEPLYRSILKHNEMSTSKIYLDLSFADELLEGNGEALMKTVERLCVAADGDCRWFFFGSDWIMLAKEHKVERYIPALLAAVAGQRFWSDARVGNLLHDNAQRFLDGS